MLKSTSKKLEYQKKYREAHKEEEKAYNASYWQMNKEKIKVKRAKTALDKTK